MSRRRNWIVGLAAGAALALAALLALGLYFARRFEPYLHQQTIAYLERKFDADVELASLNVRLPLDSPLEILARGGAGAMVRISGDRVALRLRSLPGRPTAVAMRGFSFEVDLKSALDRRAIVRRVRLEGLVLNLPSHQQIRSTPRPGAPPAASPSPVQVHIQDIVADGARLTVTPRDPAKAPLLFEIYKLSLASAGPGLPMRYQAELANAKPPGLVRASGHFGPWNTSSPSLTPLSGAFDFRDADLSVFHGIAGTLAASGRFHGAVGRFTADGEARVPDFRLTVSGNPVPLNVSFHAAVDGTNGNTLLESVEARLGQTLFDLNGAVVRHAGEKGKTVDLDATLRSGRLEDVLLLAVKGPRPILHGALGLRVTIVVPPGKGPIERRLQLRGTFRLAQARFTNPDVQRELDIVSRRAQGQPNNSDVVEVPWNMNGRFEMAGGLITFPALDFSIPGAQATLAGDFRFSGEQLNFRGTARVDARVSQMMKSRWKRWLLKPVDPFFARDGYGTVTTFRISGTRQKPEFSR